MNSVSSIHAILRETTGQLRKGEVIETSPGVVEVYAMPKDDDPSFAEFEKVDVHFVTIAVNKAKAEEHREVFIAALDDWPDPEMLAIGPSYIAVGGVLGDQGLAFEMFALGKVLGIWEVITPETLGATGDQARQLAGAGYIMCTGYRRKD